MKTQKLIKDTLYISIKSAGIFLSLLVISSTGYAIQYKDLNLKVLATVSETYDDNITFTKDNKAEDFITTLALGLSGNYEGKRQSLGLDGHLNHRFNARFSDIKNSSETISGRYKNQLSRYDEVNLLYSFIHSYTPASFEEALERIAPRRETFLHRVNFNYRKDISENFSTVLRYAYRLEKFSEEFREDQYNNSIGVNINYKPKIETTYFFAYTYSQNKFKNVVNTLALGARRYLTKSLYLDGQAGGNFSSSRSSENDRANPYANISLTAELDQLSTASLGIRRSDEFSSERGDVSTSWQINGDYSREFLRKFRGSLSVFYGENKFYDPSVKNTLLGASGFFMYEFIENLIGQLQYVYGRFDSSDEGTGYTRNTILIGLQKIF